MNTRDYTYVYIYIKVNSVDLRLVIWKCFLDFPISDLYYKMKRMVWFGDIL